MLKQLLLIGILALTANVMYASGSEKGAMHGKAKEVTFIAKLDTKSGKKVWVSDPKNFTAEAGKPLEIHVKNEFKDAVHGFKIEGLIEAEPIPGSASKTFKVTPKKAGKFAVECHMHPAHVGTTLVVK